jgi:hypothetical protein
MKSRLIPERILILSVGCKDDPVAPYAHTVTGIDGNMYHTVTIGTQGCKVAGIMRRILTVIVVILFPSLLPAQSGADTVVLKDGRTFRGVILGDRSAGSIAVRLDNGIVAQIPLSTVAVVRRRDGKSVIPEGDSLAARADTARAAIPRSERLEDSTGSRRPVIRDRDLPLAVNDGSFRRPEFAVPHFEFGAGVFMPDVAELKAWTNDDGGMVGMVVMATVIPFDRNERYCLVTQFSIGLGGFKGMSAMLRLRFEWREAGVPLWLSAGYRASLYSPNVSNYYINISSAYPILQGGLSLLHERIGLFVEVPVWSRRLKNRFENVDYSVNPAGIALGLLFPL